MSVSAPLAAIRAQHPLLHCISNIVSANDCANLALAIGASPIMAQAPQEMADIAALASAVVLNTGTPDEAKFTAARIAGATANRRSIPVVLDPVGVGASQFRRDIAAEVLREVPVTVLRCNASELQALSGLAQVSRGVDAGKTLPPEALRPLAEQFAAQHHCVAAVTGAEDIVTDGKTTHILRNGTPLLRRVTGAGCMLSVLTAAFVGANPDRPLAAAAAAVCAMGLCGETAAARLTGEEGTGTLRMYLMDAVSNLTGEQLDQGANDELYC